MAITVILSHAAQSARVVQFHDNLQAKEEGETKQAMGCECGAVHAIPEDETEAEQCIRTGTSKQVTDRSPV